MQPGEEIQGNISKSFARPWAVYLLLRFEAKPRDARRALGAIAKQVVTSAAEQERITREWKAAGQPLEGGSGVGMMGLASTGYTALGWAHLAPADKAVFDRGMADDWYLWQPLVNDWEERYRTSRIDGFVMLADSSESRLAKSVDWVRQTAAGLGSVIAEESGFRRMGPAGEIERFGFRDGVSAEVDSKSILSPDPAGGSGCYASFLKIEQDVAAFDAACGGLAQKAGMSAGDAAEYAMGRRKDGWPMGAQTDGTPDGFTFDGVGAEACPFHSHVRLLNPRDGTQPRILRRGMSYGSSDGGGLLFLSLQKRAMDLSILMGRAQKERDPILAKRNLWPSATPQFAACDSGPNAWQRWQLKGQAFCFPFADVTALKGGEHFWIPSMTMLRKLDGG